MISIEECVELAIRGLEVYVHRSEEVDESADHVVSGCSKLAQ